MGARGRRESRPGSVIIPGVPRIATLLLAVCLGCSSGESWSVEELRPLLAGVVGAPGAESELALGFRDTEYTDEIAVLGFDEVLALDGLDLPAVCAVDFELRLELGAGRREPESVEALVAARARDGSMVRERVLVSLRGEPTRHWFRGRVDLRAGAPIERLELSVARPHALAATDEPEVVILRPRARWKLALTRPPAAARRVLLVTFDTLRADHLGCYGNSQARSPCIDAFAADSVRFESAWSASNVTNPSHASILTSLHLKDHEVRSNLMKLSPAIPNLVSALRGRGFRTAAFVASHNFEPGKTGFDELFDEFHPARVTQRRAEDVNGDVLPWLTRNRDRDFFAWVHYYDAHGPYDPPHPFNALFPPGPGPNMAKAWPKPSWRVTRRNPVFTRAQYLGEIAYLDHHFGELVRHLRGLGILDRMLIAVTSDHGESLGEHGISFSHKGLHETTTRVPLFVRVPGVEPRIVRGFASTLDVYPTLFDWLDLPLAGPVRGRSLRPQMESGAPIDRERVFAESDHGTQVALRSGEWLAILGLADRRLTKGATVEAQRLELYDKSVDAGEVRDVAGERAELAQRLRTEVLEFLDDALTLGSEPIMDEDFAREIEGLGYTR